MALESEEWPFSIFTRIEGGGAYLGRWRIIDTKYSFDTKENDYDYVGAVPSKYTKLADREWVEW